MTYTEALRAIRARTGMSIEAFAFEAGYNPGTWGNVEREQTRLTVHHIEDALAVAGLNWHDWARMVEGQPSAPQAQEAPALAKWLERAVPLAKIGTK